jgi:hypothetical protein
MPLTRPLTFEEQEEVVNRLHDLTWAAKQLESPDVDWIRPECETDEQILTEISYNCTLAKPLLERLGHPVH